MTKKKRGPVAKVTEWVFMYLTLPILMYLNLIEGVAWPPYVVASLVWLALLMSLKYISKSGFDYYVEFGEEHQCLPSGGMRFFTVIYNALFSGLFFYYGWLWTSGALALLCLIQISVYVRLGSLPRNRCITAG